MAKFTVDRKTWYRGQGSVTSYLVRKDGMRCCIGFVGQQCGIPDADLLNVPTAYRCGTGFWPSWIGVVEDGLPDISRTYLINDSPEITDSDRELKLQEIFTRHGDEIVFVD